MSCVAELPRRLPSLTSLRWFAALVVFADHTIYTFFPGTSVGARLAGITYLGDSGVAFFFVLSGFVLAWSYGAGGSALAFYRRRFARIAPTYWIVALAWIVLDIVLLGGRASTQSLARDGFSLTFLQAWVPDSKIAMAGNPVDWTLSVEVFLYATLPLLIRPVLGISARARALLGLLSCALGSVLPIVLFSSGQWGWRVLPIARLPEFALGICLCGLVRDGRRVQTPVVAAGTLTLVGLAVAGSGVLDLDFARPLTLAPMALLIWACASADVAGASTGLLRRPELVRLGQWSFAFYLVHLPVMRLLHAGAKDLGLQFGSALAASSHVEPRILTRLAVTAAALAAAVALAGLLHRFVEHPLERRLRSDGGSSTPSDEPLLAARMTGDD